MGDLGHLRGQKESSCDWVGCGVGGEGGEEEKGMQDGTGVLEGWLGKGRGSHAQRGSLMVRGSVGMGRDLQWMGGECSQHIPHLLRPQ